MDAVGLAVGLAASHSTRLLLAEAGLHTRPTHARLMWWLPCGQGGAAWERCGGEGWPREAVKLTPGKTAGKYGGADLTSSMPRGTFSRLRAAAVRHSRAAAAAAGAGPPPGRTGGAGDQPAQPATEMVRVHSTAKAGEICVTAVSEFGFAHERCFADAAALGAAMIEQLGDSTLLPAGALADARCAADGTLCFISVLGLERQKGLGNLLCSRCGAFFAGEKGLRHHLQVKHGESYDAGTAMAGR
eukprot:COSAG01_NODE_2441_length_7690_cov_241.628903_9_plen_244_part_00